VAIIWATTWLEHHKRNKPLNPKLLLLNHYRMLYLLYFGQIYLESNFFFHSLYLESNLLYAIWYLQNVKSQYRCTAREGINTVKNIQNRTMQNVLYLVIADSEDLGHKKKLKERERERTYLVLACHQMSH
jgi:hypothetical protein